MFCRLAVLMAEKDPQLTQRQLARDTGLSPTTVNKLFTNSFERVDVHTIEILCDYLKSEVGDLLVLRETSEVG